MELRSLRIWGVLGCSCEMSGFVHFWLNCIPGGWDFAVSEFASLDIACIAIGSILYFRRNKVHRDVWEENLEDVVRKYAGILISLWKQIKYSKHSAAPHN